MDGSRAEWKTDDDAKRDVPATRLPVGIIVSSIHGFGFIALAVVALYYFGSVFILVAAIIFAISAISLSEAWQQWREWRRANGPAASRGHAIVTGLNQEQSGTKRNDTKTRELTGR